MDSNRARPLILCAGEALIDMVPAATAEGRAAFVPLAGGSVFNTAVAAARLGAPVAFFWGISQDMFGEMLGRAAREAGIDLGLAVAPARPTTLAFLSLVEGQARYLFLDENSAGRMLTPADLPAIPAHVAAVFLGGISLAVEPCGTAMEALAVCALEAPAGRLVMLDPNIRPGFVEDEPAYRARLSRMIALSHVVKVSHEDLHWLMGEGDMPALARRLRAMGPGVVLVTLGAEGVFALTPQGEIRCPAARVEVVDTVGAGDTFNAGFLAALCEMGALSPAVLGALPGAQIRAAIEFAIRAAGHTVARLGADPPWRHEL